MRTVVNYLTRHYVLSVPDPLSRVPVTFAAGDSVALQLAYGDYPAPTWAGTLYLRGPSSLNVTGTATGTEHAFTISTANSVNLQPGTYTYSVRMVSGSTTTTVEKGRLTVSPNIATAAPGELESYAEQQLAICRTARENILRGEMKLYMIGGRQVQLHSLDELQRMESYWLTQVQMERGLGFGRAVRYDVVGLG